MPEAKFTEEEMNAIKEIQANYLKIQQELGQSAVTKLRLAQQIESINNYEDNLTKEFIENQEKEKKFIEEVTKKYGEGQLNPETGVFTTIEKN
tara:strand:+ start:640 stop:918 length:279 start_codon:yes stop_codon:yes gene_type:complete